MSFNVTKMYLNRKGKRVSRFAEETEVKAFVAALRDQIVPVDLVRIGGDGDGGYLMPDDFDTVRHCFSPGVDVKASFETQLAQDFGIRSFLADASVSGPPEGAEEFDFEKKFLGAQRGGVFMTLADWVARKPEVVNDNDMILQMDIEGGEFEVLIETTTALLRRFRMMAIEFHDMQRLFSQDGLPFLRAIFAKLAEDFQIAHIHPNNCSGVTTYRGISIPHVFEVTFIRKDRVAQNRRAGAVTLPHLLDRPNGLARRDFPMPEIWWKAKGEG